MPLLNITGVGNFRATLASRRVIHFLGVDQTLPTMPYLPELMISIKLLNQVDSCHACKLQSLEVEWGGSPEAKASVDYTVCQADLQSERVSRSPVSSLPLTFWTTCLSGALPSEVFR